MKTPTASELDLLARGPIFFEPNRVSRTYRGGKLLASMRGLVEDDGGKPEEWIASTVRARNLGNPGLSEGLSAVEGLGLSFAELVSLRKAEIFGGGDDVGLLVKFIDSSIRLAAQVHPDKAFARERFGSPNGKTEMWIVLAVRPGANLFIGFREGVTRAELSRAIDSSETDHGAVAALLNEVAARPGDAWLIPGRMAHAIGAGCLILEIQEPTDFTIRPEVWSGERRLTETERYAGLIRESALDCFDFGRFVGIGSLEESRRTPEAFRPATGVSGERIIDRSSFPDFGANRFRLEAGASLALAEKPSIVVVTSGRGSLEWDSGSRHLAMGNYFFLPRAAGRISVRADDGLELIECLPPLSAAQGKTS